MTDEELRARLARLVIELDPPPPELIERLRGVLGLRQVRRAG